MNRRTLLKKLYQYAIPATPFSTKIFGALNHPSFVLIHDSSDKHQDYRSLLQSVAPYVESAYPGWRTQLVVWDAQTHSREIRRFVGQYGRNTEVLKLPVLVAVPSTFGIENEVELWNLDWLAAWERSFKDACYPISGGWWSVEGDWNPTVEKVRKHCFESPNHSTRITAGK